MASHECRHLVPSCIEIKLFIALHLFKIKIKTVRIAKFPLKQFLSELCRNSPVVVAR